jgi:acyl-coenzyme A thioesterase PaaI-like protein
MKRDLESSAARPIAFQDRLIHNHCYGCGPNNPNGLHLKSSWSGEDLSVAHFTPRPWHCAGPKHFVNGGVLATLIDCHSVCTAAAAAYRDAGREIGSEPGLHYATAKLDLEYLRPTPIDAELALEARIVARTERTYVVSCTLAANGKIRVSARVEAIEVPASWILAPRA